MPYTPNSHDDYNVAWTKPAQTNQGATEPAAMFETQARLHYRMSRTEWACLSDLAFFTLMSAFSERVRIASSTTFEVWENYTWERKTQLGRKFNMGDK